MKVVIHQPNYLPGLTYFDKIARADVFVILDHVQYTKNNWTNRNRIKTSQGPAWLTVPVVTTGRLGQPISQVEIDGRTWATKHWNTLQSCYGRTPGFREYADAFHDVLSMGILLLRDLNVALIQLVLALLGLSARVVFSSQMQLAGSRTDLLVNICSSLGADTYLSGPGGRRYHDEVLFERAGIAVQYQEFEHPEYPQTFGVFERNLSIVDLLFNAGRSSREVLVTSDTEASR